MPERGRLHARAVDQARPRCATPIVMLTSVGRSEDPARLRRLGINAYLTKPVKHSDLLDALARCVAVAPSRRRSREPRGTGSATRRRRLRMLVAEDNPVNRTLVTTILEKRGHTVDAVEDGARRSTRSRRGPSRSTSSSWTCRCRRWAGSKRRRRFASAKREPAAHAHRRADGARDEGRSRALPGGRHGRLSVQADRRATLLIATVERLRRSRVVARATARRRRRADAPRRCSTSGGARRHRRRSRLLKQVDRRFIDRRRARCSCAQSRARSATETAKRFAWPRTR